MTYMLLLNCALKLVEEIILYYDARSKKHQKTSKYQSCYTCIEIVFFSNTPRLPVSVRGLTKSFLTTVRGKRSATVSTGSFLV